MRHALLLAVLCGLLACACPSARAPDSPISSELTSPGPWVTARASICPHSIFASARASETTTGRLPTCSREAISGTTPPYGR